MEYIKRYLNADFLMMRHACGFSTPIDGDLVEIGVDSWHSAQPMNDQKMLKAT